MFAAAPGDFRAFMKNIRHNLSSSALGWHRAPGQKAFFTMALATIALAAVGPVHASAQKRPNIVIILADDMGFSDISSYGGEIPTPNIDRLAENGVRFTQFYNNARCSPTRAALLTGLNPHQAGMGYLSGTRNPESKGTFGRLHERAVTISELLSGGGYYTALAGKWHLGTTPGSTPWTRGFQRSLSASAGGIYFPNQQEEEGQKNLFIDGEKIDLNDPRLGKNWYGTDLWTDWSIKFIEEARSQKKPFFMMVSHVAPHFPLMAPEADIDRFKGQYLRGWDELRQARFERQKKLDLIGPNLGLAKPEPTGSAWSSLNRKQKARFEQMMAIYAATVSRMDQSVGRLVAHLKSTGEFDNTIILFLSDNGGNAESGPNGRAKGPGALGGPDSRVFVGMNWAQLQNTPLRSFKHFTYEGGIATPMIVHWPKGLAKSAAGRLDRTPAHVIDVMPTLLELSGVAYPARFSDHDILPAEGVSLVPALRGQTIARKQPLYWEHEGNRAVRDGRWKAVMRFMGQWELYDLDRDRTETENLAKRHPERLQAMAADWQRWADRSFVDPWTETEPRMDWGGKRTEVRE